MNVTQIFNVNLADAIYGVIILVMVSVFTHYFEVHISEIARLILERLDIKNQLNEPIKVKWLVFITVVFLISLFSLYYYYNLIGVEEGKINCIFPDGSRKVIPISETHNKELINVFPQLNNTPFVSIGTYATNGRITSTFHEDKLHYGLSYFEITFKNLEPLVECNSGWMIGPLSGFDAHNYSRLSFEVKGENGGEKFGVKFKDTNGCESKVNVTDLGVLVTTNWQNVDINLGKFYYKFPVDVYKPNVISIYSDGSLYSGNEPETIYVRGFKFS